MGSPDNKPMQGDLGEANRGVGQEIVGEPSPGPLQRPLDPAAGGPGTGGGAAGEPKHQRPIKNLPPDEPDGTYGQG